MPIALYMDQHVPRSITAGLRSRNVDVLTASEDGASMFTDPELLERASLRGRIFFSQDDDLLTEAAHRQAEGVSFAGVVYAHQMRISIGACIHDLTRIALVGEPGIYAIVWCFSRSDDRYPLSHFPVNIFVAAFGAICYPRVTLAPVVSHMRERCERHPNKIYFIEY
jgi:hypothetical protein